jgi:hypothetical protein
MKKIKVTNQHINNEGEIPAEFFSHIQGEITELHCNECTDLISLPENLPDTIEKLILENCKGLTSLTRLPKRISELNLKNCIGLTSLSGLPYPTNRDKLLTFLGFNTIFALFLIYLYGESTAYRILGRNPSSLSISPLKELAKISAAGVISYLLNRSGFLRPQSIQYLNLEGCRNLVFSSELTQKLLLLESWNARILYPQHFNPNPKIAKAKEILEAAIEEYRNDCKIKKGLDLPQFTDIRTLLHRFSTENVKQRGGLSKILKDIIPVLEELERNPEHLVWMESIAKRSLAACVNQPVGGWLEIAAMLAIARAGREAISKEAAICDKIAAAKHLLVFMAITNYVASLPVPQKPGRNVEIEAGNALFREVHKRLLRQGDITKPWLGVPESIAFERTITGWLNPPTWLNLPYRLIFNSLLGLRPSGIIEEAYEKAQEILKKPLDEILDDLCNGPHFENFSELVFPEKLAEIKEKNQELQGVLDEKIAKAQEEYAKLLKNLKELAGAESKIEEQNKAQTESTETLLQTSESELQEKINQKKAAIEEMQLELGGLGFKWQKEITTECRTLGITALTACDLLAAEEKKENTKVLLKPRTDSPRSNNIRLRKRFADTESELNTNLEDMEKGMPDHRLEEDKKYHGYSVQRLARGFVNVDCIIS